MSDYRLYYLDTGGHIFQVVELDCGNDYDAIETAAKHSSPHGMELWQRNRRVQVFGAKTTSRGVSGSGEDVR